MAPSAWEAIFMLLVLKIPVVYLAVVVWWAIRAEPAPGGAAGGDWSLLPVTPCGWEDWKRRRHGLPRRGRPNRPAGPRVRRAQASST